MAQKKDNRKPMVGFALIIVICFICIGCLMAFPVAADNTNDESGDRNTAVKTLNGTEWQLKSIVGDDGKKVSILADTEITLEFDEEGKIAGLAGCNRYFATYAIDGNKISFGQAGCTMMAGPEPVMKQETTFLKTMESVAGYHSEGDKLTLSDSDGKDILFFTKAQMPDPEPLTGTKWVLNSYNDGNQAVVSVLADTEITMEFNEEGKVAGSAGCNRYFATYEIDGNKISFGQAGCTMMAGPEPVMKQETTFLKTMESVAGYHIEGDKLTLSDSDGKDILFFTKAQIPTPESLTGTKWVLNSYNDGNQAVVSVLADTEITLEFDEEGKIAGSAGCNRYFATYAIDGNKISFGQAGCTKMAGPEPVMKQETTFLKTMESVAGYHIESDKLTLTDSDGKDILFFATA